MKRRNEPKEAKFVVKKSVWPTISLWIVLCCAVVIVLAFLVDKIFSPAFNVWIIAACALIIPVIIQICKIIVAKCYRLEFHNDRALVKYGVFSRHEDHLVFAGIRLMTVHSSFWGRIFNYGNLTINFRGGVNVEVKGIAQPMRVKKFLEHFVHGRDMLSIL